MVQYLLVCCSHGQQRSTIPRSTDHSTSVLAHDGNLPVALLVVQYEIAFCGTHSKQLLSFGPCHDTSFLSLQFQCKSRVYMSAVCNLSPQVLSLCSCRSYLEASFNVCKVTGGCCPHHCIRVAVRQDSQQLSCHVPLHARCSFRANS